GGVERRGASVVDPRLLGGEARERAVTFGPRRLGERVAHPAPVAPHLAARHVPAETIAASEWLFVEGYVFANPSTGQHAVREALRAAKAHGVKIALTCSDAFVPQVFAEPFHEALKQSDLLFCNATEAMAVAGGAAAHGARGQ